MTAPTKPRHDELLEVAHELEEAAAVASGHARDLRARADDMDIQIRALRVRADELLIAAVEIGPDSKGGWEFDGVRQAARKRREFTVEAFTRVLGTEPIQTIGWIRALVDEGLLTTGEDADGLRLYTYSPAEDEAPLEAPAPVVPPPEGVATNGGLHRVPSLPVPGTGGGERPPNSDLGKLIKRIENAGGVVERGTRGGHYSVYYEGHLISSMTATPSGHNTLKKVEAKLKRNGLPL